MKTDFYKLRTTNQGAHTEIEEQAVTMTENEEKEEYHCEVCGRKIIKEEYNSYDWLCWECWDDQMTEECEFEEDII